MNQYGSAHIPHIPDNMSNSHSLFSIEKSERSKNKGENVYVQTGRYDEEFAEVSQLGCGGFGTVCKAIHKFNGNAYAIKKIPIRDGDNCVKLFKELKILANLNSDFVVKYYTAWIELNDNHDISVSQSNELKTIERSLTKSNQSDLQSIDVKSFLFIQMELCSSTLKDIMDTLNTELNQQKCAFLTSIGYYIASELFIEILESIDYLHKMDKPVIHRDLKPANILITDGSNGRFVKIADFGLSTLHEIDKITHTQCVGTIKYMAPEVLSCRDYNTKADLFSLGVIMNELFDLDANGFTYLSNIYNNKIESKVKRTKYRNAHAIYHNMVSNLMIMRPLCEEILYTKSSWALSLDELLTDKTLNDFEQKMIAECMSDERSDKFCINFIKQRFSQRGKNPEIKFKECRTFKFSLNQFLLKDNNYGIIDASNYMLNIFENLKRDESAKLDPLLMKNAVRKRFEDQTFGYNIALNIESGFKITGISKVEINNFQAQLNMDEFKFEIRSDLTLAELEATGNYDLNGRVLQFIPIFGTGLLSVGLKDITCNVKLSGTFIDGFMKAESLDINMSYSSVSINFENQPKLLNNLIDFLAKPIVDLFIVNNRQNMERINKDIKKSIDRKFKYIDVQRMLSILQKFEKS